MAGGEIGEALPVADEASRFRGSAPIGGHDSGRESVGTTVGKRTPPLRIIWGLYRCGGMLGSGYGPDRVKMAPFKAISGVPPKERICRVRVS